MTIGIIGYGRFGGLWAHLLANEGHTVLVYDTQPTASDHDNITFVNVETVVNAHYLFLTVPISAMEEICKTIAPYVPHHTTVVDMCSVKLYPASVMRRFLLRTQPLISTHPLFGPDSVARAGISGHKIVVCPLRIDESTGRQFESLLLSLKLQILYTTAEEHDRAMARSQALVHFIGRGMSELNLQEDQPVSTPDYQSLLRMRSMVEHDTWQLFYDIERYNPFAKDVRRLFLEQLQRLERNITDYEYDHTPRTQKSSLRSR